MPSVGEQQLQQQPLYISSAAELRSLSLHPASVTSLVIKSFVFIGLDGIGPEGYSHLAQLRCLTQLKIDDDNQIGPEGCRHLAQPSSQFGETRLAQKGAGIWRSCGA
eukprot:5232430-Amphidinium_carterae.1